MNVLVLLVVLATGLPSGQYAVGFRQLEREDLTVHVWYPARSSGRAMTFADYLEDRAGFETFLTGAGLGAETINTYLGAVMLATRNAPRAQRRFPLVLVGQGNEQSAADQAVLCEFLAAHGYVVAATPSPMRRTPMTSADEIGQFAELQAAELARAIPIVVDELHADASRIGVVGHSFGARAVLLLAMRDERVRAIVSLDGGIGTALGAESMKSAPSYKAGLAPPLLHLYEANDAFMQLDFSFLRGVGAASLHTERIDGLHHVHFSTLGFAAAALPELAALTGGGPGLAKEVVYLAVRTLRFLDLHLR